MNQKKVLLKKKNTFSDEDSDPDLEERPRNSYLKNRSGAFKDDESLDLEPLIDEKITQPEWRVNPPNFLAFAQTEGYRRCLVSSFILIAIIANAFLITVLIQNSQVIGRMENRAKKIGTCNSEINLFDQNEVMYVGRTQTNQTTVVANALTFQQFRINHKMTPSDRGRPIWLSRQNEVWIPNTDLDTIEIYQSVTMNLKEVISTTDSGNLIPCFAPKTGGYHPIAGQFYRGQVWVSCVGSIPGWAVFDPFTRAYEAFIPLPLSFGPFTPYDVAVGQLFTVVSLLNTSITTNANLIQFSNINFLPTILSQAVGGSPILAYRGHTDSFLFVSSFYDDKVYKMSFSTLVIEYTWVNITQPWGLISDTVVEALLYVVESGTNSIRVFLIGSPYFEFPFSPIATPVDQPAYFQPTLRGEHFFLTSLVNDSITTVFSTSPNGIPENPILMETGPGSFYLTNNAITCLCELCYT